MRLGGDDDLKDDGLPSENEPPHDPASHDLRRRAIAAMGETSLVVVADRVLQVLLVAILARLLTPEETGVVAGAGAVVGIAAVFSAFGIHAVLVQSRELSERDRKVARGALLGGALATFALLQAVAPFAGGWFRNPEVASALRVTAFLVLAQPLAVVATAGLMRGLKAQRVALADLLSTLAVSSLVTIPLALNGFGFWSLAIGNVTQIGLRALLLCWFARERLAFSADFGAAVSLYRRGSGYLLNSVLQRGRMDAPRWVLGRFLPIGDLGLFMRATGLVIYPAGLFGAVVDRVAFPAVAMVQDQATRLRAGALDAVRLTAVLGLPITVTLWFLGPDVILFLLGPRWEGAIEPFRILCVAACFRLGDQVNWFVLRGLGRPFRLAVVQVTFLICMIVACVAGVRGGLPGIAAAVAGVTAAAYVAGGVVAMRTVGVRLSAWAGAHGYGAACGLLTAAIVGPVVLGAQALGAPSYAVLAVGGLAALTATAVAAFAAPSIFLGPAGRRAFDMASAALRARLRKNAVGQP